MNDTLIMPNDPIDWSASYEDIMARIDTLLQQTPGKPVGVPIESIDFTADEYQEHQVSADSFPPGLLSYLEADDWKLPESDLEKIRLSLVKYWGVPTDRDYDVEIDLKYRGVWIVRYDPE